MLAEIPNIRVPILFIAGEQDVLVAPKIVKDAYNLANEPKDYVLMKNIGHDYRLIDEQVTKVNETVIQFVISHT